MEYNYASLQAPKRRKRKFKKISRFYIYLACAILVLGGVVFGIYSLIAGAISAQDKLPSDLNTQIFQQYLDQGQYSQAKAYWDTALNKYSNPKTQKVINEQFNEKLKSKVLEFANYCEKPDFSAADFQNKYANLQVFAGTANTSATLIVATDTIAQCYIDNTMSYELAQKALDNMSLMPFLATPVDTAKKTLDKFLPSKQAYSDGQDLMKDGKYLDAMIKLKAVLKEDKRQYASAQELIKQCGVSYYTTGLSKAKELAKAYDYNGAVDQINQLLSAVSGDEAKKQELQALLTDYKKMQSLELVDYNGPVEHLFTHCLIAFPEIGFGAGGSYDKDCIDVIEFKRILDNLYKNNYILVDIHNIIEEKDVDGVKTIKKVKLKLPKGKKPFVLSIDDVTYDERKMGNGMVDKLIVKDDKIATYTKMSDGKEIISQDNEVFPILDKFVEDHPDFSFNGAKGTLCLTGFDGILGYRTQVGSPNRDSEIAAAKKVVDVLKKTGWTFASHSYNHGTMEKMSDSYFLQDAEAWQNEVASIVGKTTIYVYPYGNWVASGVKHQKLLEQGFELFCGVGGTQEYFQPLKNGGYMMDRRALDGYSLRHRSEAYKKFFDCREVYDKDNRTVSVDTNDSY